MDDITKDRRFSHISKDPRFRRMPKNERKVKIDKRFKDMFSDKKFKLKYSVDKRGRPLQSTTNENLKKYYELSDSESDSTDSDKNADDDDNKRDDKEDEISQGDEETVHPATTSSRKQNKKKKNVNNQSGNVENLQSVENVKKKKVGKKEAANKSKLKIKGENALKKGKNGTSTSKDEDLNLSQAQNSEFSDSEEDRESDEGEDDDSESGIGSGPDFARGEGNLESSSSSEDEDDNSDNDKEEKEEEEGDLVHDWAELDKNVPEAEELGRRLAMCNMDWDRIKARDMFVLLQSFVPTGGTLKSVKIYPSEYGLQRMKEEEMQGPKELVESKTGGSECKAGGSKAGERIQDTGENSQDTREECDAEDEEGGTYHREKLRQYQLNRLKYYYAVVETDSIETANKIYEECDGMEYESSSTRLDLRFIPDHMTFDQEVKSECSEMPGSYKPNLFSNTALAQSKVDLTWDETDRDRLKVTMHNPTVGKGKKVSEEIQEEDIRAYLASSSDEEEPPYTKLLEDSSKEDEDDNDQLEEDEEDHINKYKRLLQSLTDTQEDKKNREVEMEITWEPGLRETTEKIVKKKEKSKDKTPWEEYLMKKKEKKKEKREEKKKERLEAKSAKPPKQKADADSGSDSEVDPEVAFSDDELPEGVDMGDPYFSQLHSDEEEESKRKQKGKKESKKKKKKGEEMRKTKERGGDDNENAELALLMMDEEEDKKRHFNLKSLMENEEGKKGKKKKTGDSMSKADQDDFEMNVADPRFKAIYSSHLYNIDPSAKEFKKTKGMDAMIQEKLKRRNTDVPAASKAKKRKSGKNDTGDDVTSSTRDSESHIKDSSLANLVKSVKSKTKSFQSKSKR